MIRFKPNTSIPLIHGIKDFDVLTIGFREKVFQAHADTNHFYDDELPYSFHLKAVGREIRNNINVLYQDLQEAWREVIALVLAADAHDLIEDTRVNYNELKEMLRVSLMGIGLSHNDIIYITHRAAEMVWAVTNIGRGRNRAERMPDEIYKAIRETADADYLKIGDRAANIKYSIFTGSRMTGMYAGENNAFISKVTSRPGLLESMIEDIQNLFK